MIWALGGGVRNTEERTRSRPALPVRKGSDPDGQGKRNDASVECVDTYLAHKPDAPARDHKPDALARDHKPDALAIVQLSPD